MPSIEYIAAERAAAASIVHLMKGQIKPASQVVVVLHLEKEVAMPL